MSPHRCYKRIACIVFNASLLFASFSAAANDRTFCVSTISEFLTAMTYWTTSSDDNVVINLVQGTYQLTSLSSYFDQFNAGGSAGLVILGGETMSGGSCVGGPNDGSLTMIDGGSTVPFALLASGNITIRNLTLQNLSGQDGVDLYSTGNGVLLRDVIMHDIRGQVTNLPFAISVGGPAGVLIDNNLIYRADCGSGPINCSALYFAHGGDTYNIDIVNTTITSNRAFGITADENTNIKMANDILWANSAADIQVNHGGILNISFSDYATVVSTANFSAGSGNIHVDPLFDADWSLQTAPTVSPAINEGAPPGVIALVDGYTYPPTDLAGHPRLVGSRVDMGPYESSYNDLHNLIVSTTADSGAGSLRQAILTANGSPGPSHVMFNIPGACGQFIVLQSNLPAITYPMFIDGYSQPGSVPNSEFGVFNAQICDIIASTGDASVAFDTTSELSQLTVSGLFFVGFNDAAIKLENGSGHSIAGNGFAGGSFLPLNNDGVRVTGTAANVVIGGEPTASENIFRNSTDTAVYIDSSAGGITISHNLIGMANDGITPAGNQTGIFVDNSPNNVITTNIIGNSATSGIVLAGPATANSMVQSNIIGLSNADDSEPNQQAGVLIQFGAHDNAIGASISGAGGNLIDENGGPGVWISSSGGSGNMVVGNELLHNGGNALTNGLAIDLGSIGPDANQSPPASSGPDDMQNHPLLLHAYHSDQTGEPKVLGTLDAAANSEYRLDFYCDISGSAGYAGRGIAGYFYGFIDVTTDAIGHVYFDELVPGSAPSPCTISATATSMGGGAPDGNTSEISNAVLEIYDDIFNDGFDSAQQ